MAYDRYVAICNPVRYKTIMNEAVCIRMTAGCWGIGLMDPIPHIILISRLSFCGSHTINHFFCDPDALMKLSCTSTIETLTYTFGLLIIGMPFMLIITSYINTISDILKIQSVEGQRKAFSTCACHIIVIILFCGSLSSTYIRPTTSHSEKEGTVLSLLYVLLTPMCNPIIYTLKNKDFKNSIRKKNKNEC
ncbi:olfactory receptor 5V1-like [Pleurodeles waltl]|uniref:olfactory receptor 5V1-like n=1 Tax=Pleurodeles waltl TaxID=8319 RepID=UPI003709C24C